MLTFRHIIKTAGAELSFRRPKGHIWAAKSYAFDGRKDSSAPAVFMQWQYGMIIN